MKNQSEIRGLLGQVKEAADKIKARIEALDSQIEALYAKRSGLLSAPLSKDDYLATIRLDIQSKSRMFLVYLKRMLENGRQVTFPNMKVAASTGLSIRYLDAGNGIGEITEGGFYYYFEDAIVTGVERALEDAEWPVDAVPAADRQTALSDLDQKISALTVERDTLVNDLVSCGVTQ